MLWSLASACLLHAGFAAASTSNRQSGPFAKAVRPAPPQRAPLRQVVRDGEAEARLIEVYKLIGQARGREAMAHAESLVKDHPNFQLAQLVYGDLLASQARPVRTVGDVPDAAAQTGAQMLAELREESQLRIRALREKPPVGAIPAQFLQLSLRNKHAMAIDTSRARLYLFENTPAGLKLVGDYYISVGKSGIEKSTEGDLRTHLASTSSPATSIPSRCATSMAPARCRSTIRIHTTCGAARPAAGSGCMARPRRSSRARPRPPTAAWCWPTPTCNASSARWKSAPPRW